MEPNSTTKKVKKREGWWSGFLGDEVVELLLHAWICDYSGRKHSSWWQDLDSNCVRKDAVQW